MHWIRCDYNHAPCCIILRTETRMSCKNICTRYKATKHRRSSYYAQGYKRCSMCEIFIVWDGIRCPCCDLVLRTVAHQKTKEFRVWMWWGSYAVTIGICLHSSPLFLKILLLCLLYVGICGRPSTYLHETLQIRLIHFRYFYVWYAL